MATFIDVTDSTEALRDAATQIGMELSRRDTIEQAEQEYAAIAAGVAAAMGRRDGQPWAQPVTAAQAYGQGEIVTHRSKEWESLIPVNVTEPGNEADPQHWRWWRDLTPVEDETAWDPNGRAYKTGDVVTYEGTEYRCLQAHTSQPGWAPPVVPALWVPIEEGP